VTQGLTILPVKFSLDGENLLADTYDGNGSSCNFFAKKNWCLREPVYQTSALIDILNVFMNYDKEFLEMKQILLQVGNLLL